MKPEKIETTWLDRAISWLSPNYGLQRARQRAAARVLFSYEGARTDRRASSWSTGDTSANSEIGPALVKLRERSRDLVRNNAYASNAIDELAGQCVGTGITAQAKPAGDNIKLAKQTNEAWKIWVDECDADGQLDFYGIEDLVVRTVIESGECLIRRRRRLVSDGLHVPFQLQIFEPDYLDHSKSQALANGGRIIQGVEFDPIGRRVAYWMFPEHPGDMLAGYSRSDITSYPIPAEDILHVYRKKRQQVRGVPWIAPVIISMRDLDEYMEAELVRKKIEACFATFVTQMEGPDIQPLGSTETNGSGQLEETMEPGMVKYLKQGEDVKFATPSGHGEGYRDFMRDQQTKTASGIGLTYEQFTGDLSNVNYSSYRAGLLSFRTKMDSFRWLCLVPMFLQKTRRWFIDYAFAAGRIDARDYGTQWSMPGYGSVNPEQDAKAALVQLRSGIRTWPQIVGEEGYDPMEQLAEIKSTNDQWDENGIILDCDPRQRTAVGNSVNLPAPPADPQPKDPGGQEQ